MNYSFQPENTLMPLERQNTKSSQATLPVISAASAMRNVEYDIRTNNAVSNNGKSLRRVNFVRTAVRQPMNDPMKKDILKIHTKLRMARKNADVSNPPLSLP